MTVYELPERAEVTFVATRHETGSDLVAVAAGCRVAAAEELRNLVAEKSSLDPTGRHYLNVHVLLARADELDPEGSR